MTAAILCAALLSHAHASAPSWWARHGRTAERMAACHDVALTASDEGVDPALAVALAWHESRLATWARSSRDARGSMQTVGMWRRKGWSGPRVLRHYLSRSFSVTAAICRYSGRRDEHCHSGRKVAALASWLRAALPDDEEEM